LNADIQLKAVSNAWNERYAGEMHRLLLDNINRMSREKPYSNSVAILQSSGSGKSRMVHEQSALVFTLPFNLRAQSDSKDMAYPPPDQEIRGHLDWQASNLHEGQTRYLHLLGHLFRAVSDEVQELFPKVSSYVALANAWRSHLQEDNNRSRIYGMAVRKCTSNDLMHLKQAHPVPDSSFDPADLHAVSREAKFQLARLLQCIDKSCKSIGDYHRNEVKVMLYFDEAHVLAARKVLDDPDGKDMYDVLCSCFNRFLSSPIFVIYLSTTSNISFLAPQGSLARSARARANANDLQAPITETPFDCAPTLRIKPDKLRLEDLYQTEFMAQFGRPMFWTLLAGAADHKDEILSTIIDLARAKLICSHDISAKHTDLKSAASTAVLDVLLNLNFEPRRESARTREAELVASHMRTAFSVPKDREYIRSGYPSEPILAEAAARQMDEFQAHCPDTNLMARLLKEDFSSGLLDLGLRGEVVFRQLILEAYMRAVRRDHPEDSPRIFSKGCKLITFIEELFSEDYATQILNSVPDNLKSQVKFSEAFANAIVRFTHFGKMADDTGPTSSAMFAAFVRCMAIICWSSQEAVDVVIPVLLESGDKLKESTMTGMLLQIKRRKVKGSRAAYEIDQKVIGFFPPPCETYEDVRPYITLVAELGVQLPISPAAVTEAKVRAKLTQVAQLKGKRSTGPKPKPATNLATPSKLRIPLQPERIGHPRDTHPRYSIFAYGCSDTVYKVIARADRPLYKFLLGNRDFLDEHARKDASSLSAVRRMKPFWSAGTECYHWIDEPFLRTFQDWRDDDGELRVGKNEEDLRGDSSDDGLWD
jgi:hypothetical protein